MNKMLFSTAGVIVESVDPDMYLDGEVFYGEVICITDSELAKEAGVFKGLRDYWFTGMGSPITDSEYQELYRDHK